MKNHTSKSKVCPNCPPKTQIPLPKKKKIIIIIIITIIILIIIIKIMIIKITIMILLLSKIIRTCISYKFHTFYMIILIPPFL